MQGNVVVIGEGSWCFGPRALAFNLTFLWGAWQLLGNTLHSRQVNQRRGELGTQEPVLA